MSIFLKLNKYNFSESWHTSKVPHFSHLWFLTYCVAGLFNWNPRWFLYVLNICVHIFCICVNYLLICLWPRECLFLLLLTKILFFCPHMWPQSSIVRKIKLLQFVFNKFIKCGSTHPLSPALTAPPPTKCQLEASGVKPVQVPGFKPACEKDGLYKAQQCFESVCWCVNTANGEQINGSLRQGRANCNQSVRAGETR